MKMAIDFRNQIPILVELQKFDLEILNLEKEKKAQPLKLENYQRKLEEKEEEIKSIEREIREIKLGIKEKELELKSAEEEIKKLQQQLFQVKTNKEYKSLLGEIGGKKADNSLIEDSILELMEKLDQKEIFLNKEKDNLRLFSQEYEREKARINKEIQVLEGKINEKKNQREKIAEKVEPGLLSIYTRLLKNKAGLAIVPVSEDACGGCHLSLRPQVINEIKKADKLVTCERCSRILYLNE